ncbi:MAG: long-chain N-acyl amino acid synthase [Rubrivivax sp.]|nr:long-chain N-acyl amino acid synthase [Rubrivivax sp.]
MSSNTIIAAAVPQVRAGLLSTDTRLDLLPDGSPGPRLFKIKSAEERTVRNSAEGLLRLRYAWRGYQAVSLPADQTVNKITLTALEQDATIGTITVSLDGPEGLAADDIFGAELRALRDEGRRICEFTKLAVDPIASSKRVLAALFHVAYVVSHRMRGYDTIVIEVNPRHVRYYERVLGFRVLGEERLNRRVNAPAVLLAADFDYIREQIGTFGGQPELAATERSLYPHFFSLAEEAGIIARMMKAQKPASPHTH